MNTYNFDWDKVKAHVDTLKNAKQILEYLYFVKKEYLQQDDSIEYRPPISPFYSLHHEPSFITRIDAEIQYWEKVLETKIIRKADDDDSISYTYLKEDWEDKRLRFDFKILSKNKINGKWEFKHTNGEIGEDNPNNVLDNLKSEIQNKEEEIAKWEKVDSVIIKLTNAVDCGRVSREETAIRALVLEADKILYNDIELQIIKRNSGKSKFKNLISDKNLVKCKSIVRTCINELEQIKKFLSYKLNWINGEIAKETENRKRVLNSEDTQQNAELMQRTTNFKKRKNLDKQNKTKKIPKTRITGIYKTYCPFYEEQRIKYGNDLGTGYGADKKALDETVKEIKNKEKIEINPRNLKEAMNRRLDRRPSEVGKE